MATLNMFWYGRGLEAVKTGDVDWDSDTIKVALVEAAYTPNQSTHQFFSDITNEASGSGYTAGGETLSGKSTDYSFPHVTFDANDVSWDPSSVTARYAVVYKDTGSPSTSPLIGYGDAGGNEESVDAAFNVNWHADGIFRTTVDQPA